MLAPALALVSLFSLITGALTFQPARVPARGLHSATLQVESTGMVHIEAKSGAGVACTLIDRVNGPFASAGKIGKKDCATDQLLAAGTYKIELSGSAQGRGDAVLTARPFAELNQPLPRLADGNATEQSLATGQQASYWVHVQGSSFVWLRARGRTAGTAVLWRDGDWREPVALHGGRRDDAGLGHPIYEWRVEQALEEGDYLFVVYGTEPLRWSEGKEDDTLRVEAGFPLLPANGRVSATLPRGGSLTFRAPLKEVVAALELPHGMTTATTLGVHAIGLDGAVTFERGSTCDIAARSQEPLCAVVAQSPAAQVFEVRGAPGTPFVLEVGPFAPWDDSLAARSATDRRAFGPPANIMPFRVQSNGRYDVDLRDLPPDPDAAPLSCMLLEGTGRTRRLVARDDWRLPDDGRRPVSRAFNYPGDHEVLAFAIGSGRDVVIRTSGERKSHCELFRVDAQGRTRVASPTDDDPTCRMPVVLTAGTYELQLDGGDEGVETVVVAPAGTAAASPGAASKAPVATDASRGTAVPTAPTSKTGCKLPNVQLESGLTYHVVTSRQGSVTARSLRVQASATANPRAEKSDELWRADPPLSAYTPVRRVLPALEADKPAYVDFGRAQTHSWVFEAKEAGVYALTTEGLLATTCDLRTPTVLSTAARGQGGRGRNCLVESYLGPGRYLATATTLGQSQGRASALLTKRSAKATSAVTLKQPGAFTALAGELVRQPLVISSKRAETLELDTSALGPDLLCRLEDAEGWPLAPASSPCHLRATLKKGRYVWMQMPLATDTRRQTALTSTTPPRVLKGARPHAVALNQSYQVDLAAAGHDTFSFRVPAALDARVVLDHEMRGRLLRQSDDRKSWTPVEIIAARAPERQSDDAGGAEADGEGTGEGNGGDGDGDGDENPRPSPQERQAAEEASAENAGADFKSWENEGQTNGDNGDNGDNGEQGDHGEDEGEGNRSADESSTPPPSRAKRKTQAQLIAELPVLHLAAGRYRLVTEHAHGDSHIRYQLSLVTDDLMPGLARDIDVPFKGRLRLPESGLLELRTEGATDVTCRLFRDDVLLAESHDNDDDWNCGLSEPLPAGDYQLIIEAASLQPGPSHVVVNMAAPQEGPRLLPANAGGETRPVALKVGARPISLTLAPTPPATPATPASSATPATTTNLLALRLHGDRAFSWALLDGQDHVKARRQAIKDSTLVLSARGEAHRVLVWSKQGKVDVQAKLSAPAVIDAASEASGSRARIPRGGVLRVNLARAGRYAMSPDLLCASEKAGGLLQPCGPEASLDAGPTLFAAADAEKTPGLALTEHAKALEGAETFALTVGPHPFLQRQTSRTQAVHLLRVRLLADVGAEPSCSFASGVRALRSSECLALSTAAPDAIASVSLTGREAQAELTRMAWPLPAQVQPLSPGEIAVTTERLGARAALPAGPWQVSLLLPPGSWAAVLGPAGVARDFCPPEGALSRCVLTGRDAAELWLWTPSANATNKHAKGETKSEVTTITGRLLAGTEPTVATLGTERHVFESWSREPRLAKLQIPAANKARRLLVAGAEGCVLHDFDGTRLPSCNAALSAGHAYEMALVQGTGPVRATALPVGWEATPEPLLFARPGPTAASAPMVSGQAVALAGTLTARTLTLAKDAVVNVRAASGVCGLFDADAARVVRGAGEGCSLSRWLPAGRYLVAVRAFAERPLDGALVVTQRPIEGLGEGKGAAQTIGPDETRLFRFDVKASGHVGLGLEVPAETLACEILDGRQAPVGTGCQQLLSLAPGPYFLAVSAPRGATPTKFRPVLLGLAGSEAPVPSEYLEELRERSREASAP